MIQLGLRARTVLQMYLRTTASRSSVVASIVRRIARGG